MSDSLATQAVIEEWAALGRRLFTPGFLTLIGVATALFVLTLVRHSSVPWIVLTGLGPALALLVGLGWLVGRWLMPRTMRRRLAHLPHRDVGVGFDTSGLTFQTATERLEVGWDSLAAVRPLPSFWVFRLQGGTAIPLPRALLSEAALSVIRAAAPAEAFADTGG